MVAQATCLLMSLNCRSMDVWRAEQAAEGDASPEGGWGQHLRPKEGGRWQPRICLI